MYSLCKLYNASFIWFAEDSFLWYLRHERQMLELLQRFCVERSQVRSIRKVVFIGSSAGGYSAIRLGVAFRAQQLLRHSQDSFETTRIFSINAQTGFQGGINKELIKISSSQQSQEFSAFGQDPIYLDVFDLGCADARVKHLLPCHRLLPDINLKPFIEKTLVAHTSPNIISLHYDQLNPIEAYYSRQLLDLECVLPMPAMLGFRHSIGAHILGSDFIKLNLLANLGEVPLGHVSGEPELQRIDLQ